MLDIRRDGPFATVTLDRPEVLNAFNAELIAALAEAFSSLGADPAVRGIVLAGSSRHFCAGADVNWMRSAAEFTPEENREDALRMARMFRTISETPKPVCARIHGHALGGGTGLAAACDYAIAADHALFAFSETKLGIIPAVISTFVFPKIGLSNARALFTTGRRFDAQTALRIGLVHEVVPAADLDARVAAWKEEILSAGPVAAAEAKRLCLAQAAFPTDERIAMTAEWIARLRVTPEAQKGLQAFLDGRKPEW